jgi:spore maturation protein CgeB
MPKWNVNSSMSTVNPTPLMTLNLRALARMDRQVFERICLPVDAEHLSGDPPQLKVHRNHYPLHLDSRVVDGLMVRGTDQSILIFGTGLGELVMAALDANPKAVIVAWDRDPAILRTAFTIYDFSSYLLAGRLRFALGVDLVDERISGIGIKIFHPLLRQIYSREEIILTARPDRPRALVCAGGLFVDDVSAGLQALGYAVFTWDIHRLSPQELDYTCRVLSPKVVVAINHTHGLAEACRALGVPLIVWEIDPSTDGVRASSGPTDHVHIHTYRETNVQRFMQAGFVNVHYTPLASNVQRRCPSDTPLEDGPQVCFVGTSMLDQAQLFRPLFLDLWTQFSGDRPGARAQGDKLLESILAAQRIRPRQHVIPALMRKSLSAFVDADRGGIKHCPISMVSEMAAAERRLNVVARLGGEGIEIWGDPGWKSIEMSGAIYRGFAGHSRELTDIYRRGLIHVDVNRLYQLDIVPMRIFDIMACGGFVLAEHSAALASLFRVGEEVESWTTVEELVHKVKFYKENPAVARKIAQRGLAAVRTRHTITGRLEYMLEDLSNKSGRSAV